MLGFEEIKGGDMNCLDCKQERETCFIPVNVVCTEQKEVQAHTIRVCAVCCSINLSFIEPDNSRRIHSSFRWKK
jgi:hypothetical protein